MDLQELLETEDEDIRGLTEEELEKLQKEKEKKINEIKLLLIPKDSYEGKNIIMEIRAGVGGEEATLFAKDLFKMYLGFADRMNLRLKSWTPMKQTLEA